MPSLGKRLREAYTKEGIRTTTQIFSDGLANGRIKENDLSIRELAQSFMGDDWEAKLERFNAGIREGTDAIDASAFSNIGGQLLIDYVKAKYKLATLVGDMLFTTIPITNQNLQSQREPFLSDTVDDPDMVQQGQEYPATQFQAQWLDHPAPEKFGRICRVTMEMIFADKTRQAIESAQNVGTRVGLWVEKQKLRTVCGLVNPYTWNDTNYNTYLASGAWKNLLTNYVLTDWTSFNTIEQLFANMLNPVTGEPIEIPDEGNILTVPAMYYTTKRIVRATTTRTGSSSTHPTDNFDSPNPLEGDYNIMRSKHLRKMLINELGLTAAVADTVQFYGDFKSAFIWREVFAPRVVQAPPGNPAEFNQDIALQVKANVYGKASVREPRYVVMAYNSSAT